jgi:hypothetical protein
MDTPYGNKSELGQLTADTIKRLIDVYTARGRVDTVLHRELMVIDNREAGANEWVQVMATIITNPLSMYPADQCKTGWMPTNVANELVEGIASMFMQILDVLQAHEVPASIASKCVDISEIHMLHMAKLINDYQTK